MALALNKILIAGLNTSQTGATFQYANVTCGVGNAVMGLASFIPPGIGYILNTTSINIDVNTPTGNAAVNSWTTIPSLSNGSVGMIISDGQNVRANAATGTQTCTFITINPGSNANVSGTFNNV